MGPDVNEISKLFYQHFVDKGGGVSPQMWISVEGVVFEKQQELKRIEMS